MAESSEKSSNRFSKALLTRILAVGAFILLGTGAVIYLIRMERSPVVQTSAEGDLDDSSLESHDRFSSAIIDSNGEIGSGEVMASYTPANFNDNDPSNESENLAPSRSEKPPSFKPSSPSRDEFNSSAPSSQMSFTPSPSGERPSENRISENETANARPSNSADSFDAKNHRQPSAPPDRFAAVPNLTRPVLPPDTEDEPTKKPAQSLPPDNDSDFSFNPAATKAKPSTDQRENFLPSLPDGMNPSPASGNSIEKIVPKMTGEKDESSESGTDSRTRKLEPWEEAFSSKTPDTKPVQDGPARNQPLPNQPLPTQAPPTTAPSDSNLNVPSRINLAPGQTDPQLRGPIPSKPDTNFSASADNRDQGQRLEKPDSSSPTPTDFDRPVVVNEPRPQSNPPQSNPSQSNPPQPNLPQTNPPPSTVGMESFNPAIRNQQPSSPTSSSVPPIQAPPRMASTDTGLTGGSLPVARTANVPGERKLEGMQAPSLTVEKISPREVTVNEPSLFVIVIRNVGRVDAIDVRVHDQVPANTSYLDSTPQGELSPDRRIVWNLGTVAAGQEVKIEYRLTPTSPGEIGSVAHVTFATQASMRTIVTQPELEMTLKAKPVATIGSVVVIEAVVTNRGNGPAKQVLIQNDVPPELEFREGYRELEYEVGTLLPGQSKRIQLALQAVKTGRVKNRMVATAVGGQKVQQEIDLEIIAPEIKVASDGPTKRFLNRQVAHTFRIGNSGTAPATNVELVAKLPRGLRFVSANNQGVYRPQDHSVAWSMAQLPINVDASVELVTLPMDVGNQDIQFQVAADLNQRASTTQALQVEHSVDIYFDIQDLIDPIEVGAETAYQVRLVNQGTINATNVQLQTEFPSGIEPLSVEGNLPHQLSGQRIQFAPIANLKPGAEIQVRIRAKGVAPGDHRVVLTLRADGRDTVVTKEEATRVYADR